MQIAAQAGNFLFSVDALRSRVMNEHPLYWLISELWLDSTHIVRLFILFSVCIWPWLSIIVIRQWITVAWCDAATHVEESILLLVLIALHWIVQWMMLPPLLQGVGQQVPEGMERISGEYYPPPFFFLTRSSICSYTDTSTPHITSIQPDL